MVYVLLVEGFEEIEAFYPIDVLRRCKIGVKTIGAKRYVAGANKITVEADIDIADLPNGFDDISDIEMLILPGGAGRMNLKEERMLSLIKGCCDRDIAISAICGAPEILGEIGFLKNKRATCYPGLEDSLVGAIYVDSDTVVDDGLITAKGAGRSEKFSYEIAKSLCKKEKVDEVFARMVSSLT